jgi:hypothetical protein
VAQFPGNVRVLTSTTEAMSLPPRSALAVLLAECAVLVLRASAIALLLSPALLLLYLLAG